MAHSRHTGTDRRRYGYHERSTSTILTMTFTFNKEKHYYELDGKRLYGITNVLGVIAKPALIQWAANEAVKYMEENFPSIDTLMKDAHALKDVFAKAKSAHRRKKEDAATKGHNIHEEVENLIKEAIKKNGGIIAIEKSENPQIQKFLEWATGIKFLASEKKMYSETHWIAGTVDMVFEKDGKTYIGDVKTYSGIYDRTPFFQCAGYALMLQEMEDLDAQGYCIVRLGKDGSFEERWSYDIEGDKVGFLAALTLFKQLESWK